MISSHQALERALEACIAALGPDATFSQRLSASGLARHALERLAAPAPTDTGERARELADLVVKLGRFVPDVVLTAAEDFLRASEGSS